MYFSVISTSYAYYIFNFGNLIINMNISEKVIIRKIFVTRTTGLIGTKININIIKKRYQVAGFTTSQ